MEIIVFTNIRVIQIEQIIHHFIPIEFVVWNAFDDRCTPECRGDKWNWIVFNSVKIPKIPITLQDDDGKSF